MKNSVLALISILLINPLSAQGSDHIAGPITTRHRVGDLVDLYACPSPGGAGGSLTVVLDMYPMVSETGHFSEKAVYSIYLRRAKIRGSGQPVGFDTSDEIAIRCTSRTPEDTSKHVISCRTSNNLFASVRYNSVQNELPGNDFRLFAGMRSDPFFFDGIFAEGLAKTGKYPSRLFPMNIMDGINTLSIVIDIDLKKLFGPNPPTLVALAARSTANDGSGGEGNQLDRVGRPEITNVSLVAHDEPDLRDQFNLDRPFNVAPTNQTAYEQRLASNISFYDKVDGKNDWTDANRLNLARILADDFLVVDVSKPCSGVGLLEIEKAMLQGRAHQTCGGRKLVDGVMEILFSLYIGGFNGSRVSDGITQPAQPISNKFPYLAPPTFGLYGAVKAMLAKRKLGIQDGP